MKKTSLLSIALLAPLLTFANFAGFNSNFQASTDTNESSFSAKTTIQADSKTDDSFCIQVLQSAINANGECKVFATPCEVPEDWKKVNSCANFKEESNIPNLDDVTKRRHQSKWAKLREKASKTAQTTGAKNARSHKFLRKSRSFIRKNRDRLIKDYRGIRGVSKKKWDSKFRKLVSPARQKMINEKAKLQKIKDEARKLNKRRKLSGSATIAVRTGKLSNKFWSTAEKAREKRQKRFTRSSDLIRKALRSRQPFRKAKKKPQPIKKHAQLRKIYKGTKFRGNLNGSIK